MPQKILFKYYTDNSNGKFTNVIHNVITRVKDKKNYIIVVSADKFNTQVFNKEVITELKSYIEKGLVVLCYKTEGLSLEEVMKQDEQLVNGYDVLCHISDNTEINTDNFDEIIRQQNTNNKYTPIMLNRRITRDNIFNSNPSTKTIFITGWYNESNIERKLELDQCIKNTVNSHEFDEVVLLCEKCEPPMNNITFSKLDYRPTFEEFFALANKCGNDGDIVVIANTDIYPQTGTSAALQSIQKDECWALSRWDVDANGKASHFDRRDSQDIWVFRLPIVSINCRFYMGTAGCDNAIADRIQKAGYRVSNPSKTVKFNHLHLSKVNNYNPNAKVDKPYLLVTPCNVGELSVLDMMI